MTPDQYYALCLSVLVTAGLAYLLVGRVTQIARRRGMFALPGARQSHEGIMPTGGGLGMVLALAVVSWGLLAFQLVDYAWGAWVMPGVVALSIVGWLDDRQPVSALLRFVIQLAVSFGLLVLLRNAGMEISWPAMLAGGVVLVWVMNMYNFMDGSHGMAGFEGVFAASAIAVLALVSGHAALAVAAGVTAACCIGFLPWNFPRPKIFMGDAGSVPLGFALGCLLLLSMAQSVLTLPVAALVLSVFLVDSGLTLMRRVIRQERWYTPHKQHVYQRLIAHGWPHGRVLLLYQAINLVVVTPALVLASVYPEHAWPIAVVVVLLMSAGWGVVSRELEMRMRAPTT
jgi:UDP-N-acetylmuramyl pentapeptide phosphotransferase/UDP-N-acetylglucosamine-1-phosphate transferase